MLPRLCFNHLLQQQKVFAGAAFQVAPVRRLLFDGRDAAAKDTENGTAAGIWLDPLELSNLLLSRPSIGE